VIVLNLLSGCGINGDFERMRSSLVHEDVHAWMGSAARGPLSSHQLTDDERLLRDLAYPLIEPPYDRNQFYSVLGEVGVLHQPWSYPPRTAYTTHLFGTPYRSQTARYNKLIQLTIEERANTMQRIEENKAIVRWVKAALHERTASYRLALERLVIAAPSPNAVEAERSLALLQQGITGYGV
jgi:hypothetical protein